MGKRLLFIALGILAFILFFFALKHEKGAISYQKDSSREGIVEYRLSGSDPDGIRYSYEALEQIEGAEDMLHEGSQAIDTEMKFIRVTEQDAVNNIYFKWTDSEDVYQLRDSFVRTDEGRYRMEKDGKELFTTEMEYGASGPVLDVRSIEGKPAFTYRVSCDGDCVTEIYYDGLVSEKYGVTNPHNLFSYNGKIGFIAEQDGKDAVFFDGKFITEGFDQIHTDDCCAVSEVKPTVYENGTLLFYGTRDKKRYLVEVKLK